MLLLAPSAAIVCLVLAGLGLRQGSVPDASTVIGGRPLTPLHAGQVGLVACSGLINGIFGSGEERHIAAWKSKKVTTKFTEEEADGTTIIRERERFVHELSIVFATGETGTLE
jgi:hypothetical protein